MTLWILVRKELLVNFTSLRFSVCCIATFILIVFSMMLLSTQTGRFIDIVSEAVSAMGTVGLSTGVTGTLNTFGELLITMLMYIGRVGPLTVAFALSEVHKVNIEYPTANVNVG